MIYNFKVFEELRTDRINVENRKFDALANMMKKAMSIANASGELIYMNNAMYSLLEIQSEDVLRKSMDDTPIPKSIKRLLSLSLNVAPKLRMQTSQLCQAGELEDMKRHKNLTLRVLPILYRYAVKIVH